MGTQVGDMSTFSGSPIVTALLKDLKPAEPLENIASTSKFLIYDHSRIKFNEFQIMAVDVKNDDEFRLNEEILDIVEDDDLKLESAPGIKEIVLAKSSKDNLYHRGIVVKTDKKALRAQVYFVDIGGVVTVRVENLKPVNQEIMKFPILGYHVRLEDLHSDSRLILRAQFEMMIKKLGGAEFDVELGSRITGAGAFTEKSAVILRYKEKQSSQLRILAEDIKSLKVWEWEEFSKGKGTDNEICENGAYGRRFRRFHEQSLISNFVLDVGDKFTAEVTHISSDTLNPNGESEALVRIILIDSSLYQNYFNVLHRQIQRYTTLITKSNYYPSINEFVMFKLADKKVYEELGIKNLGKWCRGVRLENEVVYLVDVDGYVRYGSIPMEDYDMRRLYAEFFKVPILCLSIYPKENGKFLSVAKARELMRINERYTFKITKIRTDSYGEGQGTYEADFSPAQAQQDTES